MPGLERLAESDARIINIDYPLGMAAYHLLSRVGQGVGPLLGMYVMGKAATLNGQVGDVMISRVDPRRALRQHLSAAVTLSGSRTWPRT